MIPSFIQRREEENEKSRKNIVRASVISLLLHTSPLVFSTDTYETIEDIAYVTKEKLKRALHSGDGKTKQELVDDLSAENEEPKKKDFYLASEEWEGVTGKEDVEKAKKALEDEIKFHRDMVDKGKSKIEVLQSIVNRTQQEEDYTGSHTYVSDILLGNGGNCDAREKLAATIIEEVYPDMKVYAQHLKLKDSSKGGKDGTPHTRAIVEIDGEYHAIEGDVSKVITEEDLVGTVVTESNADIKAYTGQEVEMTYYEPEGKITSSTAMNVSDDYFDIKLPVDWDQVRTFDSAQSFQEDRLAAIEIIELTAEELERLGDTPEQRNERLKKEIDTLITTGEPLEAWGLAHNDKVITPTMKRELYNRIAASDPELLRRIRRARTLEKLPSGFQKFLESLSPKDREAANKTMEKSKRKPYGELLGYAIKDQKAALDLDWRKSTKISKADLDIYSWYKPDDKEGSDAFQSKALIDKWVAYKTPAEIYEKLEHLLPGKNRDFIEAIARVVWGEIQPIKRINDYPDENWKCLTHKTAVELRNPTNLNHGLAYVLKNEIGRKNGIQDKEEAIDIAQKLHQEFGVLCKVYSP